MAKNNPATRLHALLEKAMLVGDVSTRSMWEQVLDAPKGDDLKFLRLYHELLTVFAEAVASVKSLERVDRGLFISWKFAPGASC